MERTELCRLLRTSNIHSRKLNFFRVWKIPYSHHLFISDWVCGSDEFSFRRRDLRGRESCRHSGLCIFLCRVAWTKALTHYILRRHGRSILHRRCDFQNAPTTGRCSKCSTASTATSASAATVVVIVIAVMSLPQVNLGNGALAVYTIANSLNDVRTKALEIRPTRRTCSSF